MNNILIDSDVILDFFFDRHPFANDSARILTLCETKQIKGFLTPVIISNLYYILKRTSSHSKVISKLAQLLNIMDVLTMNKETVLNALSSNFKDFEDALQNYAAKHFENIDLILTRNVKDYRSSDLIIMTPSNFLIARKT